MLDATERSSDYQRGLADGGAQKWKFIRDMLRGLVIFLVVLLLFVPGLYNSYNDHQIKSDKIDACTHATDVTACLTAVK